MNPLTMMSIAATLAIYIAVALCATWAWQQGDWWLAVPLTIIFGGATVALVWGMENWGGI